MNKPAHACLRTWAAAALLATCAGCPPEGPRNFPLDPIPLGEATRRVDANLSQIRGALQAVGGSARGHYTGDDGKEHRFDAEAKVLVLLPRHLRFDLQILGQSHLLLGSNHEHYWAVSHEPDDVLRHGTHAAGNATTIDRLGVRPDLLIEALGLSPFDHFESEDSYAVQRITEDHQQILFIEREAQDGMHLSREYWLSRYEPRLIDRVIFRDQIGRVVMESKLTKYAPIAGNGPQLAHKIEIDWPAGGGHMTFTARGWKIQAKVAADAPSFAFPLDRGERFDQVIDLDGPQ
jgi:hypothetical protein